MRTVNARQAVLLAAVAVAAAGSLEALAQAPAGRSGTAPAAKPAVATVGARPIAREDWERRSAAALEDFRRRSGSADLPEEVRDMVRRQVLESQVRIELLALEAKRTGVTATAAEAEAVLKQDPFFNPGGKFDEQRFLAIKTGQKPAFDATIAALAEQVAARKLSARIEARYRPSDDSLRRAAVRALSRVTLEHLSLRTGDFEGAYPEPREQDVLDYYAAHAPDWQRPDRASLTVVFVNSPGLTEAERSAPGGVEAWTRRMKALADSILGQVRGGATLEQAAGFLGPRPNTVVTSDNFPGYWRAAESLNRRLFDPAGVGKVIPEAFPAAEGWLVVRVDRMTPAHVAPLRDVAREIRGLLRKDRREHHGEHEQRALYSRLRDSLAAPGWRFRLALSDTADVRVPEPTAAELDRFYRGHLADYSGFDPKTGSIVSRPLAEVREEVRARWFAEQRRVETRLRAEELLKAWRAGRRDARLESRLRVRESEPLVAGADLGEGAGFAALRDSVWSYADPRGPGLVQAGGGWIVWTVAGKVERAVPSFEQARPLLARRAAEERAMDEERGARALFDADPKRFGGSEVIHFTRFPVTPVSPLGVPLTRQEVENHHRANLDKYSAPELVTARHILVRPAAEAPEADAAARARAADLLRRARAGEEFAKLAREHSDDEATKDKGGDLGTFGRGTMLDAFERAAFALGPGDYAPEPVRTPLGWHVIYCVDHAPAVIHDLDWIYAIVGSDAAREKASRMAAARADSFTRALKGPADARAAANRFGLTMFSLTKVKGESSVNPGLAEYFARLDRAKPGEMVARAERMPGSDYFVTWVDSIVPQRTPGWESSRRAALEEYRRGAGARALESKKAELDSLLAAGWTLDSLGALWGGLERAADFQPNRGLPGLGGGPALDSLVREAPGRRPLQPGGVSGWLALPGGAARVRLVSRSEPSREQLLARMENDRAAAVERGLIAYFEGLRKRWPVRILDARMREVMPAQPPPPDAF